MFLRWGDKDTQTEPPLIIMNMFSIISSFSSKSDDMFTPTQPRPTEQQFVNKSQHAMKLSDPKLASKKYKLNTLINDGGFGSVYVCKQRRSRKRIVAKVCAKKTGLDEFKTEVSMLRMFSHRNIVTLHDAFVVDEQLWLVMERMDGDMRDLAYIGTWDESRLAYCMKQCIIGLNYLHQNHIVHRDIKLDNILWNLKGNVKLADFGFAFPMTQETPTRMEMRGTLGYRAPEVIDRQPYDSKIDIWSLGVCILEMSQSRSQAWDELGGKLLPTSTPYPRFLKTSSDSFIAFMLRMLDKDPAKRASARELLHHPFLFFAPRDVTKQNFKSHLARLNAKRKL